MNKLILIAILAFGFSLAWADSSLQFPTSEAKFIQALQVKPSSQRKAKGFGNNQKPKGVKAIVDDKPKVGALIQFDFDSAEIKPKSYPLLREFAKALQGTVLAKVSIRIDGHTDSIGAEAYNLALSKRRAQAVKEFLELTYGIKAERLTIAAYGESQPLDADDTENEKNRRVEFVRVN
jgi:outer membrane protein OmpA-like peptidoglycan-associated protein